MKTQNIHSLVALAATLIGLNARAELPTHDVSAAYINVIQNDTGNTAASVTVTAPLSVNDFRIRSTGSSRGDFAVQVGSSGTDDLANGVFISSVAQNGRDNGDGTGAASVVGTNFCISTVEINGTNWTGANTVYFPVFNLAPNGGASTEYNINLAGAYFPKTNWIGAHIRIANDINGSTTSTNNEMIGTSGLAFGQNFTKTANGKAILNLASFGIDSRTDGVLLVCGAKNEGNWGLSQVNTNDGTWNLFVKDKDTSGSSTEEDPIAFVFVPKSNTNVISGRFLGDGAIEAFSGSTPQFTITSNSVGTYELKIPGRTPANGVLIISAEGGRTINQDNIVSYDTNSVGDGWIIQTRDSPLTTVAPITANLESPGATEAVASFVYIPGPTPGFTVTPTNNLVTSEANGQATFTVALHTPPTSDVVISLSSSSPSEGTVFPDTLTFNSSDWNVPKTVTITGQDDVSADGAVAYTIVLSPVTSSDSSYNGLNPDDVTVVNTDNEGGITVSPTSGLTTTESAGTATFTVRLNTQPTGDVTIGLTSGDTSEGTVSPDSLTFTTSDWDQNKTVTVTGADDMVDDGNVSYSIVTGSSSSSDTGYNNINPPDVSLVNTDNDTAGFTVSVLSGPPGLSVVEGSTTNYTVVLNSEPIADVTINVTSSDSTLGGTGTSSVTFNSSNWNTPKTITVTPNNETISDGNTVFMLTNSVSSSDSLYAALEPSTVTITALDNEAAITPPAEDANYGTGEAGLDILGRISISDPYSPNYNGGTLTVALTNNATADDRLEVRNVGTGVGQIGVSGNSISYGGTTIATFSGGSGTSPLVMTLNGSATPAATEALLRAVTFRNVNSAPSLARRAVSVVLVDGDGGISGITSGIKMNGLVRTSNFQEGADHGYGAYAGTADCHLQQAAPDTSFPTGRTAQGDIFIDFPDNLNAFHALLRFENIFGDGAGQVPSNAVIVSAELILNFTDTGGGSPLYRMLRDWSATTETWTSMGGNGVDQDDSESRSIAESQFAVSGGGSTGTGIGGVSVMPDLLAWQSGVANYGWVMPGWIAKTDGTGFSPSEAPTVDNRPRLRIKWLPAGTASATFRYGVNGYTNAVDTFIRTSTPDTNYATVANMFVDWTSVTNGDNDQLLFRFDNIIGSSSNQIPAGSTIHAAMFDVASVASQGMGDGGQFYSLLQPWDDTNATWNTWINGIQTDGIDAALSPTAAAGNSTLDPNVQGGYHSFDLAPDVQAWVSGARPNYGFAVLPWTNGGDGWAIATAESATEKDRPQLRVYYTPGTTPGVPVIGTISRTASTVTIQFTGSANATYSVQRVAALGDLWTTIGTATANSGGSASFTDNAPPATAAFYRIVAP